MSAVSPRRSLLAAVLLAGCPPAADKATTPTDTACPTGDTAELCPTPTSESGTTPHSSAGHTADTGPETGHTGLETGDTGAETGGTGDTGVPPDDSGLAVEALDDLLDTPANQPYEAPAPGILDNDTGVGGLAVVAYDALGTAGGALSVDPDGGYRYVPAVGAVPGAVDTFSYTVEDARGGSDTASLEVALGRIVLVVDNTASGPGTGTVADPFPVLSDAFDAVDPANPAVVYVHRGDGTPVSHGLVRVPVDVLLAGTGAPCPECGAVEVPVDAGPQIGSTTLSSGVMVRGLAGVPTVLGEPTWSGTDLVDVTLVSTALEGTMVLERTEVTMYGYTGHVEVTDGTVEIRESALLGLTATGTALDVAASTVEGEVVVDGSTGSLSLTGVPATSVTLVGSQPAIDLGGTIDCTGAPTCLTVTDTTGGPVSLHPIDFNPTANPIRLSNTTSDVRLELPAGTTFTGPAIVMSGDGLATILCIDCSGAIGSGDYLTVEGPRGASVTVTNSTISGFDRGVAGVLTSGEALDVVIADSTFGDLGGSAVEMNTTDDATLDLTLSRVVGRALGGSGVNLGNQDTGRMRILVEDSTFEDVGWDAIALYNFAGTGLLDATLRGNVVDGADAVPVPFNHAGMFVNGIGGLLCTSMDGNDVFATTAPHEDIELRATASAVHSFFSAAGAGPVTAADVQAVNTAATVRIDGTVTHTNAACALP